jgi:succinate dehydrogenase / fumarate reductase cytochrome b subunit
MIPLKKVVASTVGRKFFMAMSGAALAMFLVLHIAGNLMFLSPNPDLINGYAAHYKSLGPLFYVVEWALFGLFAFHATLGAILWKTSSDARATRYAVTETKGGDSRWNLSSGNMMLLGLAIGCFVVVHVLQFRFQVFAPHRYETILNGKQTDDLYRLVADAFKNPVWVAFYVGVTIFLGLHLRHGLWSLFQSVGLMPRLCSNLIYLASAVVATVLALAFLVLPIYLHVAR